MNFKKIIPHLVAIGVFVLLASIYFSPLFNDYNLRQGDIQQFRGMEKEIVDANLVNDEDALWTNSMFGGMPAYQINVHQPGNLMGYVDQIIKLGLPRPIGLLFMAMLGFYIFALCMRVNPWLGILGAIGFGFSTINILYIGAGHVTKVNAIVYMAPALGGLLLAFRGKWILGSAVFALFLGLNLNANHLQMTYYLMFLLGAVAIGEVIRLLIKNELKELGKVVGALALATILGILPSYGNLSTTYEYGLYSTRGSSDLTLKPKDNQRENINEKGLEKGYILEYNYGKGELLSIIAPNARGEKGDYIGNDEEIMMNVDSKYADNIGQMNRYWGGQRMSGGAFYFGVFMLVFALFGLVFLKDALKWPLLAIAILALLLASNDPGGINDFFINKFPMYNKFRDSKMILVLLQVMIPAMAVLFLDKLFKKEGLYGNKKSWLIAGGVLTLFGIILYAAPSISGSMLSNEENTQFAKALEGSKDPAQIDFINGLKGELINVRTGIYKSDFGRAILLIILGCGFILIAAYTKLSTLVLSLIGIVMVTGDNMSVAKRYLNNDDIDGKNMSWEDASKNSTPYLPENADMSILAREKGNVANFDSKVNALVEKMGESPNYENMKPNTQREIAEFGVLNLNTDYRVFSFANTFNETSTSYFHKSIGGYHGAKLKRYQEIIDFHIGDEIQTVNEEISAAKNMKLREYASTMEITQEQMQGIYDTINISSVALSDATPVLNMLNVKYIIVNKAGQAILNSNANGAAWFVNSIINVNSSNEEMQKLNNLKTKEIAVVNAENLKENSVNLKNKYAVDSSATIKLTKYGTDELTYAVNTKSDVPAVFSEIYYPKGWNCYADGKQINTFRANYLLRGALIPGGTKTVVWKFEPTSFYTASKIALVGSLLLLFGFTFILGKAAINGMKEENVLDK
jgi:hypothetical protein